MKEVVFFLRRNVVFDYEIFALNFNKNKNFDYEKF